ncbi:DUF2075 domain-containing protein [bacterium]|nr:DUF2075 domain-containing protein [bacterium]
MATYLMKAIISKSWGKHLKIGLVIPMTSLRQTMKKVFKQVKELSPNMILGPNDVVKDSYDILLVDEAHRLQRRVNLTNFVPFDKANKDLGLGKDGTQLDWIMKSAKSQILFYDAKQSIRPADIREDNFTRYQFNKRTLHSQMRVQGGQDYIEFIHALLNSTATEKKAFTSYDLRLFDHFSDFLNAVKDRDKSYGLARVVAGYAWEWESNKKNGIDYDIEIDGIRLRWNSVTQDWVNSANAVNEVGCIHTIQGYDLNYAGVILGPEISYDFEKKKIVIDKDKYVDFNGKRAITDPRELELYITNIYKTLLTRGIKGTYVYVVDKKLREYLGKFLPIC